MPHDRAALMTYVRPRDLRSVPSATGGIARLACARMKEAGVSMAAVLSEAGLTLAQVNDPTVRLDVPTQIRLLELAQRNFKTALSVSILRAILTCVKSVCSTTSWPLPSNWPIPFVTQNATAL